MKASAPLYKSLSLTFVHVKLKREMYNQTENLCVLNQPPPPPRFCVAVGVCASLSPRSVQSPHRIVKPIVLRLFLLIL